MSGIEAEGPDVTGEIPQVPINFVPATEGETFALGQHEMHDETFLVTEGTIRFTWYTTTASEPTKTVDAHAGDYVVVPIRAPHTFSNPTDKQAKFVNTFTPAFYVNYFKLLAKYIGDGKVMTPEANKKAMASYATIPLPK
ncbi:hypothetical protein E4T44_13515 [Aureobasidium sp. EXF-8845]|nr:hypothetical protein E4T44_13515 [Aureobasidium sp. EXF-8845]KAI4851778.1 hypothetical protein E4T45_04946 [Aureobasidium sp. EXF-8846]